MPLPVFQVPARVAVCEEGGLNVDASQSSRSGGREWKTTLWDANLTAAAEANYTDDARAAALETLDALLGRSNGRRLQVSGGGGGGEFAVTQPELELFALGGFSHLWVALELENFLGGFARSEWIAVELSTAAIPSLEIVGGASQAATASGKLSIEADGLASGCDGRSIAQRALTYQWAAYVIEDGEYVEEPHLNVATNPRFFKLDPYTLSSGAIYHVVVDATDEKYGLSNRAEVEVSVGVGDVVAIIGGGDRKAATADPLKLDASFSYDEDVRQDCETGAAVCGTGLDAGLRFDWNVSRVRGRGANVQYVEVPATNRLRSFQTSQSRFETLYLSGGFLRAGTYIFSVSASSDGRRSAAASVEIVLVDETPPEVVVLGTATPKINSEVKQTLLGTVYPPSVTRSTYLNTTWTMDSGDLAGGASLQDVAKTALGITGSAQAMRDHDLVLGLGALVPGGVYKFTLTAYVREGDNDVITGYASVAVVASVPPYAGRVDVFPQFGDALATDFEVAASLWVGDSLPLLYGYRSSERDHVVLQETTDAAKIVRAFVLQEAIAVSLAERTLSRVLAARRYQTSDVVIAVPTPALKVSTVLAAGKGVEEVRRALLGFGFGNGTRRDRRRLDDVANDGGLTEVVVAKVVDQVGAAGLAYTTIVVNELVAEDDELANLTDVLLSNAFAKDSFSAVVQAVHGTAQTVHSRRRRLGTTNETSPLMTTLIDGLGAATNSYMDDDSTLIEQATGALVGPVQDPRALDEDAAFGSLDLVFGPRGWYTQGGARRLHYAVFFRAPGSCSERAVGRFYETFAGISSLPRRCRG